MRSTLHYVCPVKKVTTSCCSFAVSILFLVAFLFSSTNSMAQVPVLDGSPAEWPAILNNAANTKKAFKHDPFQMNGVDDQWTGGSSDPDAFPSQNWHWVYG